MQPGLLHRDLLEVVDLGPVGEAEDAADAGLRVGVGDLTVGEQLHLLQLLGGRHLAGSAVDPLLSIDWSARPAGRRQRNFVRCPAGPRDGARRRRTRDRQRQDRARSRFVAWGLLRGRRGHRPAGVTDRTRAAAAAPALNGQTDGAHVTGVTKPVRHRLPAEPRAGRSVALAVPPERVDAAVAVPDLGLLQGPSGRSSARPSPRGDAGLAGIPTIG